MNNIWFAITHDITMMCLICFSVLITVQQGFQWTTTMAFIIVFYLNTLMLNARMNQLERKELVKDADKSTD